MRRFKALSSDILFRCAPLPLLKFPSPASSSSCSLPCFGSSSLETMGLVMADEADEPPDPDVIEVDPTGRYVCVSILSLKSQALALVVLVFSLSKSIQIKNSIKAVLSGHIGSVSCLALCGEFVLSASHGNDIIVWQQPDLRRFAKFGHRDGAVKAIVTIGNRVFSAHQDRRIRVWKVSRSSKNVFRLTATLPTTKDYLGKFMKQSNYVQTRRHHRRLWIEHADSISCLAVCGGLIYSGSWDKTMKVWRVADFKCLVFRGPSFSKVQIHGLLALFQSLSSLRCSPSTVASCAAAGPTDPPTQTLGPIPLAPSPYDLIILHPLLFFFFSLYLSLSLASGRRYPPLHSVHASLPAVRDSDISAARRLISDKIETPVRIKFCSCNPRCRSSAMIQPSMRISHF